MEAGKQFYNLTLKKDGLLWRTETGATPLKKESN
jgi:hypothetical protein